MRVRCFVTICNLIALLLLTGCQHNVSGSYLATDNTAVYWLQIVRTPDNHLTGQLIASVLKPDGSIERNSTSITGAVDGENVTLSGSSFLGLQTITMAGTLNGSTLTLTGVQGIPVTFRRSTLADYQERQAELNARSQSIVKTKATAERQRRTFQVQKDFVAAVDQLMNRIARFNAEADEIRGCSRGC